MRRFFMTTCLRAAFASGLALILAACATTLPHDATKSGASEALAQQCLSQTGTRIPTENCSEIGRSYSSEDINRTGSTTAGDALRLLDPSITVHR
jgi:hypothetical protein